MNSKNIAIVSENVSKVFRIGLREEMHDSLGSAVAGFIKRPIENFRKYRSLHRFDDIGDASQHENPQQDNIIWAIDNVSFEVKRGEVLGIIGRNGAGKSTLLKILTRITPPTRGRIEIHGRVSSLLEVGTGFHQELTGRENVYLNGTILGMRKKEIDRKYDEIIDFSGVEKFIDTPVKRYSSGMKVRLAFAVAAHLEPEILIVDEVLAVGDAEFQKKCLMKMHDVSKHGRTVLFVSHNMTAVTNLCDRAILLEGGRKTFEGTAHDVVSSYLVSGSGTSPCREWRNIKNAPGGEIARLVAVRIVDKEGVVTDSFDMRRQIGIQMEYEVLKSGRILMPHYQLINDQEIAVLETLDQDPNWCHRERPVGSYVSTVWLPENFLADGVFYVNCNLITRSPNTVQFSENQVVTFNVVDTMGPGTARGDWAGPMCGAVRPLLQWNTEVIALGTEVA
ncbi:MAG: polysaccharide ABC transporter ATP-binding protein [Gammaproteobacteria bacterium]